MPALLIGETPALPLDEAGRYVAGAYIVFVLLLVIYVSIMAIKLQRIEKELRELASFAEQRSAVPDDLEAAPGRGSEDQSISVSSAPSASGGGGV
jgi:hypothetical protein